MYIKKNTPAISFYQKRKDLKFSTAAWMKATGRKKIMEMAWQQKVKNTVFQTVIENTKPPSKDGGKLVEKKSEFLFCASCEQARIKIEICAAKFIKNRGRGPDHPLLPLCGNSPCVPRFLYKGRKNVSGGRGFSSAFDRKRGFDREAARKTLVFRQPQRSSYILLLFAYKITPSVR